MKRLLRWSSYLLMTIAFASSCLGLWSMANGVDPFAIAAGRAEGGPSHSGSPISPGSIEVDLGEVRDKSERTIIITLTNNASVPARIAGVPGLCAAAGCIDTNNYPATIGPHETGSLSLSFKCSPQSSAPFRINTEIFLDFGDRPLISVPIRVVGTIASFAASS
jgi:hypothetical protein